MLSNAIKGHVETMVRPVRTRYFDPHYASVIVDRWERLTGGTAEKIGG